MACAALIITSCSEVDTASQEKTHYLGKDGRYYGGCFRFNELEELGKLFPPKVTDVRTQEVSSLIFEGLLKLNPKDVDGLPIPAIANSYQVDSSHTIYTFNIRKGVKFHNDDCFDGGKGRELKAQDVVWCYENMCTKNNNTAFQYLLQDKVEGANEFYNGSANEIKGIRIIDDYTIQFKLISPYNSFPYLLASAYASIYPKEAYEQYGEELKVGTGAFVYNSESSESGIVTLLRNNEYYLYDVSGNQLPFLDSIQVSFWKDKQKEIDAFKSGQLDLIYQLSTDDILNIIEVSYNGGNENAADYIEQRTPELISHFYTFNHQKPPFNDLNVRKAFSYAVNRQIILDKILDGAGYAPGIYGITPPIIENYNVSTIPGYSQDIDKAKQYLRKAGYKNGNNFPSITLTINRGGGIHEKVAKEVVRQIKEVLNIQIEINELEFNDKIEKEQNGDLILTRGGWRADYNSPETFLSLLYGKYVPESESVPSFPNVSRYRNQKFDQLFEKGQTAPSIEQGKEYFLDAEILAMQDAPILMLWYDENYRILQPHIRNFTNNSLQYRNLSDIWFDFSDQEKN